MIDRSFIDTVLSKTGSRLGSENEICQRLFGRKNYGEATDEERKVISKIYFFVLEKEIRAIELSAKELNKRVTFCRNTECKFNNKVGSGQCQKEKILIGKGRICLEFEK